MLGRGYFKYFFRFNIRSSIFWGIHLFVIKFTSFKVFFESDFVYVGNGAFYYTSLVVICELGMDEEFAALDMPILKILLHWWRLHLCYVILGLLPGHYIALLLLFLLLRRFLIFKGALSTHKALRVHLNWLAFGRADRRSVGGGFFTLDVGEVEIDFFLQIIIGVALHDLQRSSRLFALHLHSVTFYLLKVKIALCFIKYVFKTIIYNQNHKLALNLSIVYQIISNYHWIFKKFIWFMIIKSF